MDVEDVDVARLELLERGVDRDLERLAVVAAVVGLVGAVASVAGGSLRGNDHLVAVASLLHPLAEPLLRLLVLRLRRIRRTGLSVILEETDKQQGRPTW